MTRSAISVSLWVLLSLAGCKPPPETEITAIIGAVLIDGTGGAPVSDSVVLVVGSRIRAAGLRTNIPMTAGSEKIDGAGMFVLPALIDLDARAPGDEGLTHVSSIAEVRRQVDAGANALGGMILDTEQIDTGFAHRLRDLRVVFAPRLVRLEESPDMLARAMRNTQRLHAAGVPIGVASSTGSGLNTHREIELLAAAGLSPMEVIVAATRNGALALRQAEDFGSIEPGKRADLLLAGGNPLEDLRNLREPARAMLAGRWVEPAAGVKQ